MTTNTNVINIENTTTVIDICVTTMTIVDSSQILQQKSWSTYHKMFSVITTTYLIFTSKKNVTSKLTIQTVVFLVNESIYFKYSSGITFQQLLFWMINLSVHKSHLRLRINSFPSMEYSHSYLNMSAAIKINSNASKWFCWYDFNPQIL